MARCPDCNKFVPFEQAEPEIDLSVDLAQEENGSPGEATVSGTCRLLLNCGECGTEMAEANPDVEIEVALEHKDAADHEVELLSEFAESNDRYDGKPGTPSRYRRHFYGADISGKVKCSCGAEAEFSGTVEEQAGGFDSLV
jgi:hypothetical protein